MFWVGGTDGSICKLHPFNRSIVTGSYAGCFCAVGCATGHNEKSGNGNDGKESLFHVVVFCGMATGETRHSIIIEYFTPAMSLHNNRMRVLVQT